MKRTWFLVAGVVLVLGIGAGLVFGLGGGKPKTYTVEITSNVEQIEYESKNNCRLGDNITIEAIPLDGYRFIGWEVNGVIVSEDVEYEITLTQENVNNVYKAVYKQEFTIYIGEVQNGEVSTNVTKAIEGETITLTITPNDHYTFESAYYILDSETEHVAITNQTFTMPNGSVTVYANFQAIEYSITSAEIEHGTLSFLPTVGAYGIEIVVTVTPDEDYELSPGTLYYATENIANGEITYSNNEYKFTMPGEDVTVYATFIKTVYGLSVSYGIQNGTVTIENNKTKARMGSTVNLTVTPAVGYELETLYYTTNTIANGEITNNIFEMPGENVTVYATFVKTDYNVNLSYNNQQGTVTTNRETAQMGDEITLTITPETGYQISGLYYTKSGSSAHVGITNNTFNMPASSVTIHVTFQAGQYDISTQTSNGTFNDLPSTGTFGNTITFTLSPNTGYKLTDNSVYYTTDTIPNGVITNNNGTYSFTMPAGAVTVHAQFELQTFQVTLPEEKIGYSILNTNDNNNYTPGTVTYGSSISFRVVKDVAYSESQVTVTSNTGSVSSQGETYTISNITSNLTITIIPLTINTYTVTLPETQNGYEIKTAEDGTFTTTTVEYGQDLSFKVALETGYTNSTITVRNNGTIINLTEGIYTISNVTSNISIAVEGVTANAYTLTFPAEVTVTRNEVQLTTGATVYYDETLTLSSTPSEGMDAVYTVNGNVIEGNTFTVTGNVTIEYSEEEPLYAESYYNTLGLEFDTFNTDAKTVRVKANASNMPTGNLILPGKIISDSDGETYTITRVGSFYNCSGLTGVIVPKCVETIDLGAFRGCSNLENMTLPFVGGSRAYATNVGTGLSQYLFGYIFSGDMRNQCSSSSIGALQNTSTLTYQGQSYDFWKDSTCYYFTMYYIPQTLRNIRITDAVGLSRCAFYGCDYLTSITLNDGITTIHSSAFERCGSITEITIPSNVTVINSRLFYDCTSLADITIPNSVTSIGDSAFYNCSNLTTVNFDDNSQLTSIGSNAFYNCSSLTSITIPDSVTSIGGNAFYNCSNLTTVNFDDNSQLTSIGGDAFYNCSSLTGTEYNNEIYLGSTTNPYLVLYKAKNTQITGCNISSNCKFIYDKAFLGCSGLTSITISTGIISIGDSAFNGCSSLAVITYGDNSQLTRIGGETFKGCSNLTSVTIPSSVISVGNNAFQNCNNLSSVVISDLSAWASISFGNGYANPLYYAKKLYLGSANPENEITEINNLGNITEIKAYAFYNAQNITSINIPSSVTSIGSGAFYNCSSLTLVTIESANVYKSATSKTNAGRLLNNATTINVLASVVDDANNTNTFLNDTTKYTKSEKHQLEEGGEYYYTYTKL